MHFYESANSYTATVAEITDDGYIIAGSITFSNDTLSPNILLIKTDKQGKKLWEKAIPGGTSSGLKVTSNGYIIIGDSIQYNPDSEKISELENDAARLIFLDMSGSIIQDRSFSRKVSNTRVDFHGDAITFDDQNNLITLGTFKAPGSNEYAYLSAINPSNMDTIWEKSFNYIERDYVNGKSVQFSNGNILWGTTVSASVSNFSRSYLALPVVPSNSTFINSDYFGENSDQALTINDLEPSPLGYGAIGTYAQPGGNKANMFFIRVDKSGNFVDESVRYFDGAKTDNLGLIQDPSNSDSEDTGNAITATRDGGYVLAGSIESTPDRGNGGKDIWLVKIDAFGNPLWNKIIGGPTGEIVSSIRETADGGLLICGTIQDGNNQTGGLSSIFLIKTDSEGEIRN
jgi:hypothetical protein